MKGFPSDRRSFAAVARCIGIGSFVAARSAHARPSLRRRCARTPVSPRCRPPSTTAIGARSLPLRVLCPAVADAPPARRITRDVDPVAVRDLLDRPPRATVAFVESGHAALLPARVQIEADRRLFAIMGDAAPSLDHREVVLVIDDGPYWFQLRGISLRGIASRVDSPTGAVMAEVVWYVLEPQRVLAWDYGTVHEE